MSKTIQGFIPVEPPDVTHNDLKAYVVMQDGKPSARIRKSDRLKAYEERLRPYVERMRANMSSAPLDGPLREEVRLCYPTDGRHRQGEPKATKPDGDNVIKTINDMIESKGVIANDSRICDMTVRKMYRDPAGIWVHIEELEG